MDRGVERAEPFVDRLLSASPNLTALAAAVQDGLPLDVSVAARLLGLAARAREVYVEEIAALVGLVAGRQRGGERDGEAAGLPLRLVLALSQELTLRLEDARRRATAHAARLGRAPARLRAVSTEDLRWRTLRRLRPDEARAALVVLVRAGELRPELATRLAALVLERSHPEDHEARAALLVSIVSVGRWSPAAAGELRRSAHLIVEPKARARYLATVERRLGRRPPRPARPRLAPPRARTGTGG